MKKAILSKRVFMVTLLMVIISCTACVSISSFDQYAYAQTTSIKVDAQDIMDLAKDDFSLHQSSVREFQTKIRKVYEYEKNRPKNEITVKMWDKLLDPTGHLLGGFLIRWEEEKKLNETFIAEEKKLVDLAFDKIAGLESKKIKASDIAQ